MRATWLLPLALACRTPSEDGGRVGPDDSTATDTAPPREALVDHVVVLVLDGLRMSESFGDGTSDVTGAATADILPAIRTRLLPAGTLVRRAYVTGIPITGPGHADLITGVRHEFGHFPTPSGAGRYRPLFPTVFEQLAAVRPAGDHAPLVLNGNTDHVESLDYSVYPGVTDADGGVYTLTATPEDATRPEPKDEMVISEVKARLAADAPRLMITNLHAIDLAGHTAADATTYLRRAQDVDEPIAALWEWIQSDASGIAGRTALVLVSDHGRHHWGEGAEERLDGLEPPDYRHHGDQCAGCREIPMFLAGPGIQAGVTVDGPYTLEDVGRTVAWMLGAELPYGTGVVMRDLFVEPPVEDDRTGTYEVDTSGSAVATWSWQDPSLATNLAHRSRVEVDGTVVSAPDAFAAEAPRVLEAGAVTYACWRALELGDTTAIDWPWAGECGMRTDGTWTDLAFPASSVSSLWRPALAVDDADRLVLAYVDNPNSTTYSEDRALVKVARWSEAGWAYGDATGIGSAFPGAPSIDLDGSTVWAAWSESDMSESANDNASGRYTRHVEVARFELGEDGVQTTREVWRTVADRCPSGAGCADRAPTLDAEGRAYDRMESPAIRVDGATVQVAWIGWDDDGSHLLLATSTDGGEVWGTPQRVDATGRVFGHVAPRWSEGRLYWARLGAEAAEACRVTPGGAAACTRLDGARVTSLAPTSTGARVTVDTADGEWAVREVAW